MDHFKYFGYNLDFNPGIGFSKNFETQRFSHFSLSEVNVRKCLLKEAEIELVVFLDPVIQLFSFSRKMCIH